MNRELNKEQTTQSINRTLVYILLVAFVAYFVTPIILTTLIGTKTFDIDIVRNEQKELRLINEILTSKIDEAKSVAASYEIIEKYGLSEKNITFLQNSNFDEIASR
jgi:hypothetical protein